MVGFYSESPRSTLAVLFLGVIFCNTGKTIIPTERRQYVCMQLSVYGLPEIRTNIELRD